MGNNADEKDTDTAVPAPKVAANPFDLSDDYSAEKSKFRKSFGRKEVLFFSICSVIGLDTIGLIAAAGPEAFSWMAVWRSYF